eukprot:1159301-Pyramimonas_sp.AAC.1
MAVRASSQLHLGSLRSCHIFSVTYAWNVKHFWPCCRPAAADAPNTLLREALVEGVMRAWTLKFTMSLSSARCGP